MNCFKRKLSSFLPIMLIAFSTPYAVAQTDEFSTWSIVNVSCGIAGNWSFVGYVEYRAKDNLKHSDRWTLSAMVNYRPLSFLMAEGGYELHYRYKGDGNWGTRNRYTLGIQGSVRWRDITFSLRERLQKTVTHGVSEDRLRSRLKISYAPRGWIMNPYFSTELFQPMGDDAFFTASRIRYRPGIVLKLSARCSLDAFYCRQYEPESCRNIFGMELGLKF